MRGLPGRWAWEDLLPDPEDELPNFEDELTDPEDELTMLDAAAERRWWSIMDATDGRPGGKEEP